MRESISGIAFYAGVGLYSIKLCANQEPISGAMLFLIEVACIGGILLLFQSAKR